MKILLRIAAILLLVTVTPFTVQAQVAQWNQIVADEALEKAFHRALREASIEFINKMETEGTPAVITFVDVQFDYPLQLTTANFRHTQLSAAQNKLGYLLRYQAKTTNGTRLNIGVQGGMGDLGVLSFPNGRLGSGYENGAEIPGDGAMMLCPVNRSGLEFMYGGLSVATLDTNGEFRSEEDGATIEQLHDHILDLTYRYYGHTPK